MRPPAHLALAFLLALGLASNASAVNFPQDGHVDVFASLAVSETQDLLFGVVTDSDGTVTLDTNDAIADDPDEIHAGGTVRSGDYDITGEADQTVAVALTGSTTSGLTIGKFSTNQADLNNIRLDAGGAAVLTLGAELTVDSATVTTGEAQPLNFTIAVTYN